MQNSASGQRGFRKILQDASGAHGKLTSKIRILQKLAILTNNACTVRDKTFVADDELDQ